MYQVEITFGGEWIKLPTQYKTREDAHWACAGWRQKYGRPTDAGDPFRVVPASPEKD